MGGSLVLDGHNFEPSMEHVAISAPPGVEMNNVVDCAQIIAVSAALLIDKLKITSFAHHTTISAYGNIAHVHAGGAQSVGNMPGILFPAGWIDARVLGGAHSALSIIVGILDGSAKMSVAFVCADAWIAQLQQ